MTREEIKQQLIGTLSCQKEPQREKEQFYELSGAKHLELACAGYTLDVKVDFLKYRNLETTQVNANSAEELMQKIKEYSATLDHIEAEWQKLLREAKPASMAKYMNKIGVEAILADKLKDTGTTYSVKFEDNQAEVTVMGCQNCWGESGFEFVLNIDQASPDMQSQLELMADCAKELKTIDVPDDFEYTKEQAVDACQKVIKESEKIPFLATPNTQQQILDALVEAGLDASLTDSPYVYGTKDIKISKGDLDILITAGKIPGMLVAWLPANMNNIEGENYGLGVCVSHKPLALVVEWLKHACEVLSVWADASIRSKLNKSKQELYEAMIILRSLTPKAEEFSCDLQTQGIGRVVLNKRNYVSPINVAKAIKRFVEMMRKMKASQV